MPELIHTLKSVFGYASFRPMQREIIDATLSGRDVMALLPTGGGKSMCFQLPALHRQGLTVVVSPLIALMKDQVDQLQAAGVAATFVNSSLGAAEARSRMAGLHRGEWRILYVSPERLLLDNWQENLKSWKVAALAIDEAHCISEWGHDFRPEYRQLARLRDLLPEVPVMALTATATERVRKDILGMLRLHDPAVFVASFNRPNLSYKVMPKDQPLRQLLGFLKGRGDEAGIVYCSTRATTERVADALQEKGHSAKAYHAGLGAEERAQTQESFLRDDTRIVCATIAFGMGINKPNVRWIVHHDLPKNLAGYYQETGRAGRDGLPGDCLLLYSGGDIAKQTHFIDEMSSEQEREVARTQLRLMAGYAESANCRRVELLGYFGERFPADNCGACDNCNEPRERYDATIPVQKFLSCIFRVRQASGFGCGMMHIVDILTGADTEKVERWRHHELSTFGIGKDMDRHAWLSVGRDLLRLGHIAQVGDPYPVLEISPTGMDLLRGRQSVELNKPMLSPKVRNTVKRVGSVDCDELLLARLKSLRKRLADERGVPAYVIFGDATLRQLAREYPSTLSAMEGIFGMGEKKREQFGETFAAEIRAFLENNSRVKFS